MPGLRKFFVADNYLRVLEYSFHRWSYDAAARAAEEHERFREVGLDLDGGLAKLESVARQGGLSVAPDRSSMRSIHWALFASLSERPPIPIRRILEIGTFDGETTLLLSRLFPHAEIVTVDLPDEDPILRTSYLRQDATAFRAFRERQAANLKATNVTSHRINSFFLPSRIAGPFELVWVDGGHLYPEIAWDTCNAYHLCVPGGIIMFDDVIRHPRGYRDAYVSPEGHQVLEYLSARTGGTITYFLKRNDPWWSAVPRRRKFVAWLRKNHASG